MYPVPDCIVQACSASVLRASRRSRQHFLMPGIEYSKYLDDIY